MPSRLLPDEDPTWVDQVRRRLVVWYGQGHRDLPWRHDRDPYRILVSELMLVQTTVAAVLGSRSEGPWGKLGEQLPPGARVQRKPRPSGRAPGKPWR